MKTIGLAFVLSAFAITSSFAQTSTATENANRPVAAGSPRDGFTLRGAEMVITRNGVTSRVDRDFTFSTGLRVSATGTITLPGGTSASLRPNQLLTFDGKIQDVLLGPDGVAPISSVDTGPSPKPLVNPSSRDGIHMRGKDVFITRNGRTERVNDDVRLPNGVMVSSSGIVTLGNGNTVALRPDQVLDLNGVLQNAGR